MDDLSYGSFAGLPLKEIQEVSRGWNLRATGCLTLLDICRSISGLHLRASGNPPLPLQAMPPDHVVETTCSRRGRHVRKFHNW